MGLLAPQCPLLPPDPLSGAIWSPLGQSGLALRPGIRAGTLPPARGSAVGGTAGTMTGPAGAPRVPVGPALGGDRPQHEPLAREGTHGIHRHG